ncbi:hypothetical protein A2303_00860 [Candidatus Falkowbacteria bacterium RIFOXYB2_FULL_47_14]|uniref:UDP-N-acetylmuramoylalanine--D-glutamate ligase n=1 Tax=Candidatus Falkowbacteria bacterium RIFOXYA2_FULL_47_19 TaxID=1797994 RepID=A0A1F5SFV6_9BACT|nr:MAG: hypothetical protein A2227_00060 [Candidatus Falkowbacteria bacterium RIFOXYA2_FULL_47_19]OGF35596.1 MAG: hypothetical protein A2468_06215 [Candidatus Falkowbacteria bacterium RIFOXYC2_FULL_46_15]OGF42920.1 MAG: hypothetical protein A2303_00860 [Candidatus Falkowbacteria bacterium RIFOXYB2_FULL_47_14]
MSISKQKINAILENKKVAILGLGLENFALVKFLIKEKVACELTICDSREEKKLGERYREISVLAGKRSKISVKWRLGGKYDRGLGQYDLVMRSPGYPMWSPALSEIVSGRIISSRRGSLKLKEKSRTLLTSPMQLFFELCPTRNTIGVTGTKGKGTTASLIYHIFKTAKKRAWLLGNIGVAPFEFISRIKKNDWVVIELSSFQLEGLVISPRIAVITNFYPDHLFPADPNNPNYHKTLNDYWRAKMNIMGWQKINSVAIINKKLKDRELHYGYGKKVFFTASNLESVLPGDHNKENIGAAVAAVRYGKISKEVIARAVKSFSGLPHRLEKIRIVDGVCYYNDSFATTPAAAITAINSLSFPIVLIAGGADKGADFTELSQLIKARVKFTVLLEGKGTPKIKSALLSAGYPAGKIEIADSMHSAMGLSKGVASPGDIVLLSPACASFGIFKDYKDRGEQFRAAVRKLG